MSSRFNSKIGNIKAKYAKEQENLLAVETPPSMEKPLSPQLDNQPSSDPATLKPLSTDADVLVERQEIQCHLSPVSSDINSGAMEKVVRKRKSLESSPYASSSSSKWSKFLVGDDENDSDDET